MDAKEEELKGLETDLKLPIQETTSLALENSELKARITNYHDTIQGLNRVIEAKTKANKQLNDRNEELEKQNKALEEKIMAYEKEKKIKLGSKIKRRMEKKGTKEDANTNASQQKGNVIIMQCLILQYTFWCLVGYNPVAHEKFVSDRGHYIYFEGCVICLNVINFI